MIRLCLTLLTAISFAQAADAPDVKTKFEDAEAARLRGDFAGCTKILESAVASVKTGDSYELRVHKTLAICQYKSGRKTAAAANFRAAQNLDPKLTLVSDDVGVDDALIMFFSEVTGEKSRAKPILEEAAVAAAKTEPGLARTNLVVKTNVSDAAVMIDGILVGHGGDTIAVDVGEIEIEVSAPGYTNKKFKIAAKAEANNSIEIELEKATKAIDTQDAGLSPMEPAPPGKTQD